MYINVSAAGYCQSIDLSFPLASHVVCEVVSENYTSIPRAHYPFVSFISHLESSERMS